MLWEEHCKLSPRKEEIHHISQKLNYCMLRNRSSNPTTKRNLELALFFIQECNKLQNDASNLVEAQNKVEIYRNTLTYGKHHGKKQHA